MPERNEGRDETVETIAVSHSLRAKAVRRAGGGLERALEAADNAIAAQARGYLDRARAEQSAANEAIGMALARPERRAEALDRLYGIAHDMKGEGTTYGYPLATGIAASLCGLLAGRPGLDETALRIVQAHVEGLGLVLEHAIAGDGGAAGRDLLRRLHALAAYAADG
jgi:hypothetical protein